jgi:hypothetical protein
MVVIMNTRHTPGPWKAVYIGCGDWDLNGPVTQEDWKLAAAAPDLLEALKLCEGNISSLLASAHPKVYGEWLTVVSAAIAKSTGETK